MSLFALIIAATGIVGGFGLGVACAGFIMWRDSVARRKACRRCRRADDAPLFFGTQEH